MTSPPPSELACACFRSLLLALLFLTTPLAATAASFTVTSAGNSGAGTLRQAILGVNSNPGPHTITFNISGSGPFTITPSTSFPSISNVVTIDGTSQPGYAGAPIIELNGASAGASSSGLTITCGGCTVRGLVINRFGQNGILLMNGGTNTITGNYLGTDVTGTLRRGNSGANLLITNSAANLIGGTTAAERNIISGGNDDGVDLVGTGARNNVIQGNYIGTDVTGTLSVSNWNGIWIIQGAHSNVIGGTVTGAGNVISGNNEEGLEIQDATSRWNVIQGNFIGTDRTGTLSVSNRGSGVLLENSGGNQLGGSTVGAGNVISGNGKDGVRIAGTSATNNLMRGNFIGSDVSGTTGLGNFIHGISITNAAEGATGSPARNTVGGLEAGEGNIIAFNTRAGVAISHGTNGVLGNSIFSNGGLGIDLGTVGVLANDGGDLDAGANSLQNYPLLSAATNQGGVLRIVGSLASRTSMNYRIEFFSSPAADSSANGEGKNFLGATNLSFLAVSPLSFVFSFPSVPGGDAVLTATATDSANNTSEFSAWRTIAYTDIVLVDGLPTDQTVAPGGNASFSVTAWGQLPITYQWFNGGSLIVGATAATLALSAVQQSQAGSYFVVASNVYGAVTSAPAALNLLPVGDSLVVTNLNNSGVGSLHQAIRNANDNPGPHTITFNIPGAGPYKISLTSPLPAITNTVTIDGTTQAGFSNRPVVEVNGRTSTGDGLFVVAGGCTIRGLAINEFPGCGIVLALGPSNVVQGNFIGTQVDGTSTARNGLHDLMISNSAWNVIGGTTALTRNVLISPKVNGIYIEGDQANSNLVVGNIVGLDWTGLDLVGGQGNGIVISNASWNIIGGTESGAGNVSSRHSGHGLIINGTNAAFNRVEGNLIGTDITGTNVHGSGQNGISIWNAPSNTVGGLTIAAANVIADHSQNGLEILGSAAQFNRVQGNFIGTDRSGSLDLHNTKAGLISSSVSNNTVGGLDPGAGNTIAFNHNEGVLVDGGQCAVLGNSIFDNSARGISLLNGANNFQAAPALTAATNSLGVTRLVGRLTSTPGTTFRIEFFASPTSVGDGKTYLGATSVDTDAAGQANFNVLLATGNLLGQFTTATATDPFGNTSELSSARTLVNALFTAETPIAYEAFDYAVGALSDRSGGSGWSSAWADHASFGGSGLVLSDSLADPLGILPRTANHGGLTGGLLNAAAYRNLSAPLGADGTTNWISFVLRPDSAPGVGNCGGLVLGGDAGTGTNGLFLGHRDGSYRVEQFRNSGGATVGGIVPAQGVSVLVVARLEFQAGNDRAVLSINPTPGITVPDSGYTATFTNLNLGSFTQIMMAGDGQAQQSFDEIRFGTSYESVAPWAAPGFTVQPRSQSVLAGTTISLTAEATGTTPLAYQWYFEGSAIEGGVADTLSLTSLQYSQSGNYSVIVTNLYGSATSQVAALTVLGSIPNGLVHWWADDSNALDYIGTNHGTLLNGATYRAGKVGTAFSFDGTNDMVDVGAMPWLGSTTGLTVMGWIHRTNVVNRFGGVLGRWQVTGASNSAAASSNTFLLATGEGTVSNRVTLLLQFTNLNSYRVAGTTTLPTNQWIHVAATWNSEDGSAAVYLNGVRDGTTNFPAGQLLQFQPGYTTKIGSWGNSTNSANQFRGGIDEVMLLDRALASNDVQAVYAAGSAGLAKAPTIIASPSDLTVVIGSNVTFSVTAIGALPLAYQWNRSGAPITDATNAALVINNALVGDSGIYDVTVANPVGSTLSASAELSVILDVPVITEQPTNAIVYDGDAAMFEVTVVGSPPLEYQWSRNGSDLVGETNATLNLASVALADAGNFSVLVRNASGSVLSQEATLTVLPVPPAITSQPVSRNVNEGTNVSFTVIATGTAPLTYRWVFNATNTIPGANNSSLSLSNVALSASGNYTVLVSNAGGSVTSQVAVLTVQAVPPTITSQPVSRTVNEFTNVSFTVTATGTAPLAYQWARNAANIAGATNSALNLSNVAMSASGNYTVIITNVAGAVTSQVAVLTVQAVAPSITSQPVSRTVNEGTNVSFSVTAVGSVTLKYQWRRDVTNTISGATNSTLNLSNVELTASGNYTVVITNSAGLTTSQVAVLTVQPVAPTITSQPVSRTVFEGTNVSFAVSVTGTAPMAYQWTLAGTNVSGETGTSLNLSNVALSASGSYRVIVTNIAGSVTSQVAVLTVQPVAPIITSQPVSRIINDGDNVTFIVTAAGTAPLSYQWRQDGSAILNATNATLNLSNVALSAGGNYTVVVTNVAGSVTSMVALLTVQGVPVGITVQPASQTTTIGSSVTLSVTATGTAPLTYKWERNGVDLPGKDSSTLTITNVQASDAGTYKVKVDNAFGPPVNSDLAVLTVTTPVLAMTDNFSVTVGSTNFTGIGQSSNTLATIEASEPLHDAKPGGKSMWFSWQAPAAGIATFSTAGSDFDTLLAVYQGDAVESLVPVASDDDTAGFYNSRVQFNAASNGVYRIAVDGAGGVSGNIILQWALEATTDVLPVITNQPVSRTVGLGSNAVFMVGAIGGGLEYQWFNDGAPIPNATNSNWSFNDAGLLDVGGYVVRVQLGTRMVVSREARLQLTLTPAFVQDVLIADKFREMVFGGRRLRLDPPPAASVRAGNVSPSGPSRGFSGSQVFSTVGSLKEPGEPDHCGIPGGASQWFAFQAESDGVLALNTDGSTFDTVLAVYTGEGANFSSLTPVTCDNDSGTNGQTSSLHFITTSGTVYYVAVDGVNGASGTVVLNYSTLGEQQPPSITITSAPPANIGLTNDAVTISGTATDNTELTGVEWRVTNSLATTAWTLASGTNSWTFTASNLAFGASTIQIRSLDSWANVSAVTSRRYVRLAPVTVTVDGCGTVSPGFLGTTYREPGKSVTITATPCANSLFAGWTGNVVADGTKLTLMVETGMVFQANFLTNFFARRPGTYAGLVYDTNVLAYERAGSISIRTTTKGTYSGKLRLGAKNRSFSGRFGLDGLATNLVSRGRLEPPLELQLDFNVGEMVEGLAGRLIDTNWFGELIAYRSVFNTRTNPAPYQGRYTLMLPASGLPGTPEGDGFASVTVSASGSVRLRGSLADGTSISQGASVSGEGFWPFYVPLRGGRGSMMSWLLFGTNTVLFGTNSVQSDLAGDLRWIALPSTKARYYADGFTNSMEAVGSRFSGVVDRAGGTLAFSNGVVIFSGGNLSGPFTNDVFHAADDRITNEGTNELSLTISRSSGLLSGSVVVPDTGRKVSLKGALFQNGDFGFGYFLHTNASGGVLLAPRE